MKLGSGIAPINKMLKKGIKVGIGTDGVSSNNNLDLIEEARMGSYLQKVNKLDPTLLDIKELLKMLTVNGAKILNLDQLGLLKPDYKADMILVDINDNPAFYPHHNNLSNLFYGNNGKSVKTVIIDGKIIMENKKIKNLNQDKVLYKAEQISKKLT